MKKYYERISEEKLNTKQNAAWYAAGSTLSSLSSILLLMFTTRILGGSEGGVFSIGWSISQLVLTIGWFGSRNFQISDYNSKYQDADYFSSKILTIAAMFLSSIVYSVLLGLTAYKLYITCLLTILMGCDVIADVFSGFFQKHGYLHITGKSYAGRNALYDITFLGVLIASHRIDLSIISAIIVSCIWLFLFDYKISECLIKEKYQFRLPKVLELLKDCFPIFISAFLAILITNIPKNAIEILLDDTMQNVYNIISMPSFSINLLGMFLFVPMYPGIAGDWANGNIASLKRKMMRILLYIGMITALICLAGYIAGIPVLSLLYGVALADYRNDLILLLFAGGISCILNFFSYIITVMRKQKLLMIIYVIAVLFAQFISTSFVSAYGLNGAAYIYLLTISIAATGAFVIIYLNIYRQ
jgi:O-antigen/teichoic acid export membrane protein